MSEGVKILTDLEMTQFIAKYSKGGLKAQQKIKDEWLDYTEQAYDSKNGNQPKFIASVNQWLRRHKIPILVIDFNPMDLEIGGTDWTITVYD